MRLVHCWPESSDYCLRYYCYCRLCYLDSDSGEVAKRRWCYWMIGFELDFELDFVVDYNSKRMVIV